LGLQWAAFDRPIHALRESEVLVPSDMIAVADYDPMDTDIENDGDLESELLYTLALTGRHSRGANVIFCDSHLEYNKTNNWKAPTDAARSRWNNDHSPHW
jgi:prepilin-type processing-associated H-X9-DG protein